MPTLTAIAEASASAAPPDAGGKASRITGSRIHLHPGCYVVPHYHGWQPARWPRCSACFWCASCRVWFNGGRCFPSRQY